MGIKESKEAENVPATLTGLYQTCKWDPKTIRKFIYSKKLAPIYVGKDHDENEELEECPICFLSYPAGLNRFTCCKKGICTECFLQLSLPNTTFVHTCPFCNRTNSAILFTGPRSPEEKAKEAQEKQKVIELQIKIRNEEMEKERQRSVSAPQSLQLPHQFPANSFSSLSFPPPTAHDVSSANSSPLPNRNFSSQPNQTNTEGSSNPFVALKNTPPSIHNARRKTSASPPSRKPPTTNDLWEDDLSPEDLEEIMLNRAIALSLDLERKQQRTNQIKEKEKEKEEHIDSEDTSEEQELQIPPIRNETTVQGDEQQKSTSDTEGSDEDLELAVALSLSMHK